MAAVEGSAAEVRRCLQERKEFIETQLRSASDEFSRAVSDLQSKLNVSVIDPATELVASRVETASTSENGSGDSEATVGKEVGSVGRSRGLIELLAQFNAVCWTEDDLCRGKPLGVRAWLQTLIKMASSDSARHLQLVGELLKVRDSNGWKLQPALTVSGAEDLPSTYPGRVASPSTEQQSMDSFFTAYEDSTFKLWKELCQILTDSLFSQLKQAIYELEESCRLPIVQRLISLCCVVNTVELVWKRWNEMRAVAMATLQTANPRTVQQRLSNLSIAIGLLLKMLPLDISVVRAMFSNPAISIMSDVNGPGGWILSEFVGVLKLMMTTMPPSASAGNQRDTRQEDSESASASSTGNRGALLQTTTEPAAAFAAGSSRAPVSLFVTSSADGDEHPPPDQTEEFTMLCDLLGQMTSYADRLHELCADLDSEKGRPDGLLGNRRSRHPQSPRPTPSITLQPFPLSPHRTAMVVVEEDEGEESGKEGASTQSPSSMSPQPSVTSPPPPMVSSVGVGKATLRHTRPVWDWASPLADFRSGLCEMLSKYVQVAGHQWLTEERQWLKAQDMEASGLSMTSLPGKLGFLLPNKECLSASTSQFFKRCKSFSQLVLMPTSHHSAAPGNPRQIFVDNLEETVLKLLDIVQEACNQVPKKYAVTSLYYYFNLLAYTDQQVLEFEDKIGSKHGPQRAMFHSVKGRLKIAQGEVFDGIYREESGKLRYSLVDDLSQDWSSYKAHFKNTKFTSPTEKYCEEISSLLYKLECSGRICAQESRRLLARLVCSSLNQFTSRYRHLRPTVKRLPLFRQDIMHVLCTLHAIVWYLMPLMTSLKAPCVEHTDVLGIHVCCGALYSTLVATSAPVASVVEAVVGAPKPAATEALQPAAGTTTTTTDSEQEDEPLYRRKVSWIVTLHQKGHRVQDCLSDLCWVWYSFLAALSSNRKATFNALCCLLTVDNCKITRALLRIATVPVQNQQLQETEKEAFSASVYSSLLFPLYCAAKCTRSNVVTRHLLSFQKESGISQFLATPCLDDSITSVPLWFKCICDDFNRVLLRNLPSILVDMAIGGHPRPPIISQLPCGCSQTGSNGREHTIEGTARLILSQLHHDLLDNVDYVITCQMLTGETSVRAVIAILAQFVTAKISRAYRNSQLQLFMPDIGTRLPLVHAVWQLLGLPLLGKGQASPIPSPAADAADVQLCDLFARIVQSRPPVGMAASRNPDCGQTLDVHYPEEGKRLCVFLASIRDLLEPLLSSRGQANTKYPVDKFAERVLELAEMDVISESLSSLSCSEVFSPRSWEEDFESYSSISNWTDDVADLKTLSPPSLIVSYLENRAELWDKGMELSSQEQAAIVALKESTHGVILRH